MPSLGTSGSRELGKSLKVKSQYWLRAEEEKKYQNTSPQTTATKNEVLHQVSGEEGPSLGEIRM